MDRFFELIHDTPFGDEVEAMYDPSKERIQEQNYRTELTLRRLEKLKRCM
jgi:hypothetical protein